MFHECTLLQNVTVCVFANIKSCRGSKIQTHFLIKNAGWRKWYTVMTMREAWVQVHRVGTAIGALSCKTGFEGSLPNKVIFHDANIPHYHKNLSCNYVAIKKGLGFDSRAGQI